MASTPSSCSQVRVAVRVRPLTDEERSNGGKQIMSVSPHNHTVELLKRKFTFDSVYDESVSQSHLYSRVRADGMLEAFLDGYNATIMAYGQTGSGKTFTMGSEADYMSESRTGNEQIMGLIPRFMNDIFDSLKRKQSQAHEFMDKTSLGINTNNTSMNMNMNMSMNANMNTNTNSSLKMNSGQDGENVGPNTNMSPPKHKSQLIDHQISVSFLEVYGENIHDLLAEDSKLVLPLRENIQGETIVAGLKEQKINSAQDALQLLHDGTLNRTTAATLMNKKSSRSHAVFTIILKQTTREFKNGNVSGSISSGGVSNRDANISASAGTGAQDNGDTLDVITVSRFTFVDLAGSERMKKTGAEGERLKEGIKINEGLLALGNVINALADEDRLMKGEKVHVPYRHSKLTRLLQDALGGNSQTLFLACVSPSDTNASETNSTLKYANRARNIKNKPTKNVDATVAELQRLYALNQVLARELVRVKYGNGNGNDTANDDVDSIGEASDELVDSEEVQAYFKMIHQKAADSKVVAQPLQLLSRQDAPSVKSTASTISTASISTVGQLSLQGASSITSIENKKSRQNVLQSIDHSILGVNPDEDIALLDKILELQNIDQAFDQESKEGQKKLNEVEGELEAQEELLLQLKDNMKGYHQLKDSFEAMVMEVQSLETEKASLAKELESAQVDPSKGCSKAIKKRLNDIEAKLARARSETRKNQQMYRKMEQEAHKAKVLQQKIEALKQGKVALVRKQRDAAMKHKESIDFKSREIQTLKKKERKTGHKMTKLEAEVQKHKANLQKRKVFCDKLQDKLKKTESHLMQALALKQRNGLGAGKKVTRSIHKSAISSIESHDVKTAYASPSEELNSLKFLLEKLITDRVNTLALKTSYESKVAEYSDLMRSMVAEMKLLKDAKDELTLCMDENSGSDIEQAIKDSRHSIEDLELRLEVVENDLERIRTKLPNIDEDDEKEVPSVFETDAMKMIANLSSPVVKSLLWDILDIASKSEAGKGELKEKLKRKEAALSSFENEIQRLNQQIVHLTNNIDRRKSSESDDVVFQTQTELTSLKNRFAVAEKENLALSTIVQKNDQQLKEQNISLITMSENMAVMDVTMRNAGIEADQKVLDTLASLQEIWRQIGFPSKEREIVRTKIESCLELSCSDALEEAARLLQQYKEEASKIMADIKHMYKALSMEDELVQIEKSWPENTSTLELIGVLKKSRDQINPVFRNAIDRKTKIILSVESALDAMKMPRSEIGKNLAKIMKKTLNKNKKKPPSVTSNAERRATQIQHVTELVRALETKQGSQDDNLTIPSWGDEHEPGSLSEIFLDLCQTEMQTLKMEKARIKVANQNTREEAQQLAADMHLRGRELLSLSIHSIKKRSRELPTWWDPRIAEEVCRAITNRKTVVKVNALFTRHLEAVYESLSSLSNGRMLLSQELRAIVKSAQNTLLQTVEGELSAKEAYASFDLALAGLPPLSKETVYACIDEMETLIEAVDAMAHSEVEALTVVWDALNISNNEKGKFWGTVEESTKTAQFHHHHNFDSVLKACTSDIEEWLVGAVKKAQRIHRTLKNSLLKLSKIHAEVQKLSTQQATKSKIISLDSELRILSAKLCEFEDKANSKQRLTRKTNSSSLLKEEKFRKQMQSSFSLKLESITRLLHEWESNEGKKFDINTLSTEISGLVQNPDSVKRRTAFMHLKTTQKESKRRTHYTSTLESSTNLKNTNDEISSDSKVQLETNRSRSSEKTTTKVSSAGRSRSKGTIREFNRIRIDKSTRNTSTRSKSKSPNRKQMKKGHMLGTRSSTNHKMQVSRKDDTCQTKSKHSLQKSNGTVISQALSTRHLNHTMEINSTPPDDRKRLPLNINTDKNGSPVLPFGQVLAQTPNEKENIKVGHF